MKIASQAARSTRRTLPSEARRLTIRIVVTALAVTLVLTGCATVKKGSGVEATETRTVDPFNRISVSGAADVAVTAGQEQSVAVRGDDNLLINIETEVDGDTLDVSEPGSVDLQPEIGLTVEIEVPALSAVTVSGSGDLRVTALRGESFRAVVSGAGNVEATGSVERAEAEVSGAGSVRFSDLVAHEAVARVSGAGDVAVHATGSLTASVSGAGDITYFGDPDNLETDVSGAGAIRPG